MAKKITKLEFDDILAEVKKGVYRPIYFLYGAEGYYIDQLEEAITDAVLTEDQRDFNYYLYYGADVDVRQMMSMCKRDPMMAERQVVVLREAQNAKATDLDLLKFYAERPLDTTVLIVCMKGETKGKECIDEVKKNPDNCIYESKSVSEWNLPKVLRSYVESVGNKIDEKSIQMLIDSVGSDLTRLFGEVNKLKLILGPGRTITPEIVERNIGISKDDNSFELEDAFLTRNDTKICKIINYYEKNKAPVQMVFTPWVYSVFWKLLMIRTSRDKSDDTLLKRTEERSDYRLRKLKEGAARYSTVECVKAISVIREFDTMSKGIGSRQNPYDLMRDMAYKITH